MTEVAGGNGDPVRGCRLDTAVDIRRALEAAAIEYLDVDHDRTIVIYRSAILMVTVTDGNATAARAFEVSLWNPPAKTVERKPEEVLAMFIEELITATDASQRQDY